MKFDLFHICENPTGDSSGDLGEVLEQVEHAEHIGFDTVWIAEHHGSRYGSVPNPAAFGAAIAQRTSTIGIGSGVSILPFHHPIRIAEDYALLDVLSGGRLRFGCGRGYQPAEFELFGRKLEDSRELFRESLEVIRGCWENESFSYDGAHFKFQDFQLNPRPVQEQVPMWTVASSAESYPIAARNGLQILTQASVRQTVDELKENIAIARGIYEDIGFDPADIDIIINIPIHIEEDAARAEAVARDRLAWQFKQMRALSPGADGKPVPKGYESYDKYGTAGSSGDEAWSFSALNDSKVVLIGDPSDAVNHIKALRDEIGIDHVLCSMRFGGMDHEAVMRSMDLWAREVIPVFGQGAEAPPVAA